MGAEPVLEGVAGGGVGGVDLLWKGALRKRARQVTGRVMGVAKDEEGGVSLPQKSGSGIPGRVQRGRARCGRGVGRWAGPVEGWSREPLAGQAGRGWSEPVVGGWWQLE